MVAREGRRDLDKVSRNRQAPSPTSLICAPMTNRVDESSSFVLFGTNGLEACVLYGVKNTDENDP
jgi:hypothetical protein